MYSKKFFKVFFSKISNINKIYNNINPTASYKSLGLLCFQKYKSDKFYCCKFEPLKIYGNMVNQTMAAWTICLKCLHINLYFSEKFQCPSINSGVKGLLR